MKKHFIKIFLISLALFMVNIPNVKASCGDLIYDVIDLHINDNSITLKGWAFIHYTQNGYRRKNNAADKSSPTDQKIKIGLCDSENNNTCIYKEQDGNGYDFDEVMGIKKGNKFTQMDYTYQEIGFEIKFDFDEIKENFNKTEETYLYFTIAATNKDFSSKYEQGNCNGTELFNKVVGTERKKEGDKYWVSEKMKILSNAVNGENSNETIEIEATGADKILYTGWHSSDGKGTRISWGQIYQYQEKRNQPSNLSSTNPGEYRIKARKTTNQYQSTGEGWYYYTCANYNEKNKYDDKFLNVYEYDDGYKFFNGSEFSKTITTKENIDNSFKTICSDNWIDSWNRISYAKVYGETKLKIKIKSDKKCEVSKQSTDPMECNKWKDLSSECKELTVRNNNSSAVVKIEQNGYISNIFKSNLVNNDTNYNASSYDGGWFKYGITYYNEVSWNIGNLSQGNVEEIESAMESRLKSIQEFKDGLNLTITGLEEITGNKLIKNCSESGSFKNDNKNDNKLITVCTFFLPSSVLENFNGTVKYLEDENKANINNKYYIPLNEKEHSIKVTLENLSRLKDDKAKADSKDKIEPWTGAWNITTSCLLKVTNRLYENGKYKFIYRPINLNNPFPNRSPGVNWYTWYITEGNKDRKTLEDSYKKRGYYTELDNRTISTIKEYNKNHNYFSKVDTDFFGDYIKEGGNS